MVRIANVAFIFIAFHYSNIVHTGTGSLRCTVRFFNKTAPSVAGDPDTEM